MLFRHSSAPMLHFYKLSSSPKLLFPQLRRTFSVLSAPSLSSSFPNSSTSLRVHLFCLAQSNDGGVRSFATAAAVATTADRGGGETFFAEEGVSWNALGLPDTISQALSNAGFTRPSLVQAESIPSILSGKDSIIAAETGSGKTHSYLVPLIHKLSASSVGSVCDSASDKGFKPSREVSLVLCPNVLLCEQVVRMANGLCDENGDPLIRVAAVCGRQVFDEADMLLCGSFQNQVIRLINMFRHDEKLLSWTSQSTADNASEVDLETLPQDALEQDEESPNDASQDDDEEIESLSEEEELEEGNEDGVSVQKKGWRRVLKPYDRSKQYIFVAATLPANGKRTAGAVLKRMFPDARWVNGNYLHRHNPRLERKWFEVTVDSQVDALIEAVKHGVESETPDNNDVSRTMVFANTVEAVEAVAKILERAGIECYRYHKDASLEERAGMLDDFREKGGIFVCTDAAARGVDIPNISHVIQADFATSAVDFLHRVGRTGRAGQHGVVTSLYTESNRDLVSAIREAEKLGRPVETAFSRKRGFRNKLKKKSKLQFASQ
ncbi:unnamed protein product [Linum tenue]|uniref:RNA helicase n=1 Tax=Linum tenue TaxID=586396 RepID=A0AAV0H2V9_9ROSI|nr:unnamed protein product [Linum tenue]